MRRFWIQTAIFSVAIALAVYYFLQVTVISIPMIIGFILANLLTPFCIRLESRGWEAAKSVYAVFAGSMAIGAVVIAIFVNVIGGQLDTFGQRIPMVKDRLAGFDAGLQRYLANEFPIPIEVDLSSITGAQLDDLQHNLLPQLPSMAVSLLLGLLTVPLVAFFLLRDGRDIKRKLVQAVPNRYFEMVLQMQHRISQSLSAYIRGVAAEAFLVGFVDLVLMGLLSLVTGIEVDSILLIALLAAMTNIIPFAGPFLGTILGCAVALFSIDPSAIFVVAGSLAIGQLLDNILFAPLVLGSAISVHPIAVVVLLVIGGKIMGVLGMLVIVPLFAVSMVIFQELFSAVRAHRSYL